MIKISRLLNEVAVVFSREYLSPAQKIGLLARFYWLKIRFALYRRSLTEARFLSFTITTPSYSNFVGIVREVFIFGDYYFKAVTPKPVIIDCGANIGTTTLFFKWLYPEATITAFEPSPTAVGALRQNIDRNRLKDVTVVEAAASDSETTISFWEQTKKSGGSTSVRDVFDSKAANTVFEEVKVKAVRLSHYVKNDVDLLKMDIEGAEGVVIAELAAAGVLPKIKSIIMEFHENPSNRSNDLSEMVQTLKSNGYTIAVFASEITPSSERMSRMTVHHFLLRASRT